MTRADTKGWSLIDGDPGEYELVNLANIEAYPGPYDFGTSKVADLAAITRAIEDGDWDALQRLLTELTRYEVEEA